MRLPPRPFSRRTLLKGAAAGVASSAVFTDERTPSRVGRNTRYVSVFGSDSAPGTEAAPWRSLARVGNADTVQVLGTPFCGKGEPSQTIRVGHASPACVFTGVDVFGGED